jgi:hypothetical protein
MALGLFHNDFQVKRLKANSAQWWDYDELERAVE